MTVAHSERGVKLCVVRVRIGWMVPRGIRALWRETCLRAALINYMIMRIAWCHASMNSDTQRNLFFSRAIQSVDARTWLEIGCGAEALLSSMVLSRNDTRVFALEVNQESARRASNSRAGLVADSYVHPSVHHFQSGSGRAN